ncbi:MAG: hypothetical protein Q8N99_03665 [Nanoarchaeota archaeon]|nr:hypothetical protein [Nanoarchaeota archaeon]
MQKIDELRYGPFLTHVKITPEVREFFEKNNEKINLKLTSSADEWYQSWLLKYLDRDKDGIPDESFGKEFELIYCTIIENPEDYFEIDYILGEFNIKKDRLIFEGSIEILDGNNSSKFWARWILLKADQV